MLMSDWPLALIDWLLFCIIFWLVPGIVIIGKRYMHERHQLHLHQDLLAYRQKQKGGGAA